MLLSVILLVLDFWYIKVAIISKVTHPRDVEGHVFIPPHELENEAFVRKLIEDNGEPVLKLDTQTNTVIFSILPSDHGPQISSEVDPQVAGKIYLIREALRRESQAGVELKTHLA